MSLAVLGQRHAGLWWALLAHSGWVLGEWPFSMFLLVFVILLRRWLSEGDMQGCAACPFGLQLRRCVRVRG